MGEIIVSDTKVLIPTENSLREECFRYLFLKRYEKKGVALLPVREHPEHKGYYFVLDGHHRGTIADLFKDNVYLFVSNNRNDLIGVNPYENDKWLLEEMNEHINERFEKVVEGAERLNPINSFEKIRQQYSFLTNVEATLDYVIK